MRRACALLFNEAMRANGSLAAVRGVGSGAALALAFAALAPAAPAQTLSPGDKLVYETAVAFGFEVPQKLPDPCSIEMRLTLGVASVDATGMDVDVEIAVGIRAIRYRGPGFAFAIEPATPEGFIGRAITPREADDLTNAVLPRSLPPLAVELVRKELALVSTVASLHGRHAQARIASGPEPFVRIEQVDCPGFVPNQNVIAARYLRTALLLAFPPVPPHLPRNAEGYEAGGSSYEIVGYRDAMWPIRGREHRVRARTASSTARAAFAFEAMHDTGLEPGDPGGPHVREWASIHATLGIAGSRHVRVASVLVPRDGDRGEPVTAIASWNADLVRARQAPATADVDAQLVKR